MIFTSLHGQTINGNLEEYLSAYLDEIPGSTGNQYLIPSEQELETWNTASLQLLNDNLTQARSTFGTLNYQVIEFTDTSIQPDGFYYVLEEMEPRQFYGGTYVLGDNSCSEFITVQAPHPLFDTNTGLQAVYCFSRTRLGALMIAGTHRCNSNVSSSCDGTTSACGSSEPYRESDLSHTEQSFFQAMTEVLSEFHPTSVFVQLHGFAKQETDPYVIISNGSRTTPVIDYSQKLRDELDLIDPELTFRLAHINQSWTRLIGFTNTQGRYLNGSIDPCAEEASMGSGRFIHVEQEKEKLRETSEGWEKMALAIGRAFECDITLSTEQGTAEPKIYPLPSRNGTITILGKKLARIDLYNHTGTVLKNWQGFANSEQATLNLSMLASGIYFLKIEDQGVTITHKVILTHK